MQGEKKKTRIKVGVHRWEEMNQYKRKEGKIFCKEKKKERVTERSSNKKSTNIVIYERKERVREMQRYFQKRESKKE